MILMFQNEIKSMMYSAGDIKAPNDLASQYIERVIRSQIIQLLSKSLAIRNLRRNRNTALLSVEDICFVIRKNKFKVRRVLNSIIFKEIRKKMNDDVADLNVSGCDMMFNWILIGKPVKDIGINPLFIQRNSNSHKNDNCEGNDEDNDDVNSSSSAEIDIEQKTRLKRIDDLTSKMNYEEYMEFSDCRQASFTFRKSKKFKEFLNFNEKLKDDVVEVLGFICYEMVVDIVEEGIRVKNERKDMVFVEKGYFSEEDLKGLDLYETKEACRRIVMKKKNIFF